MSRDRPTTWRLAVDLGHHTRAAQAVPHTHRPWSTLMVAALYGVGLEPATTFLPVVTRVGPWARHGTLAPLSLGIAAGAYSGRFDPAAWRRPHRVPRD